MIKEIQIIFKEENALDISCIEIYLGKVSPYGWNFFFFLDDTDTIE